MDKKYYTLTKKQARYSKIKSIVDKTAAIAGTVLLSPIFLGIVVAIKKEEGIKAPVFFKQKRVGQDQKLFDLYKFRTMKLSTPKDTPTHLLSNPEQYITSTGKFLRRSSLDELPQFLNIIKGDMAISGPRPALWNQDDLIAEREAYGVHQIKPGLTGWAQIHGRDELEIPVKAKLDAYYLQHYGLWIDIKCFFGTILSVLKSDGVVEGGTGEIKKQAEAEAQIPKKKLLAITNHSYMFWKFRRELMAELQKDYEVAISTPFVGHEDDFAAMGCRMIETDVDRRGINPKTDLKLLMTYYKLLKNEKPDMVITYSIKPNVYAGFVCRMLKIPYCVNVQGLGTAFQKEPLATVATMMYRVSCRKAKTVFFENIGNANEFIKRHIVPKKKITVLPGAGLNLDYYTYVPYPNHDGIRFLFLGRIMKEKGIDELFYAIRKLHDEYGDTVKLDLVGFFEDEYKKAVEELVNDGIAVFHGFQEDPRPFYANADCVVLASYHEGMSNVNLEAAATGRCVITSNIHGCKEAVDNMKSGFLCEVRNQDSLYACMKAVCEMNKKQLESMGRNGNRRMKESFDKRKVVKMTINALSK